MPQTYPVVSELWTLFEGTLMTQAKKLVEDIAKHQKADPKALWAKIKTQVRVGLVDVDLPEPLITSCSHPSGGCDGGAIRLRCRAPCVIGFDTCHRHCGQPLALGHSSKYEKVDRVLDYEGKTYFVDAKGIAHDMGGRPRGHVQEGVLYLFVKASQAST
jgi:hypothetical protein